MQPVISLHRILVTPVIAFLSKPELLKSLKASPSEVSHIFSHPLEAILDPTLSKHETLVPIGSEDWPYESEVYVCSQITSLAIILLTNSRAPVTPLSRCLGIPYIECTGSGPQLLQLKGLPRTSWCAKHPSMLLLLLICFED